MLLHSQKWYLRYIKQSWKAVARQHLPPSSPLPQEQGSMDFSSAKSRTRLHCIQLTHTEHSKPESSQ